MKGTRPGRMPPASRTHGEHRTCAVPGCSTKLSAYNPADRCWQHDDVTFPNLRGKRLPADRA